MFGDEEGPYNLQFFKLAEDEQRCDDYVGTPGPPTPSPIPTASPTSDAFADVDACALPPDQFPTAVGIPASPTVSFHDIVQGDVASGDCYTVERAVNGMTQRSGEEPETYCCSIRAREYIYYNGGINADGVDTGFDQEIYATVEVTVTTDCGDRDLPTRCVVDVKDVGGCGCRYDESSKRVTLKENCNSLGVFASGQQDVAFTVNLNDDDEFFRLDDTDTDRCLHPAVVANMEPTVPTSSPTSTDSPTPMSYTYRCFEDFRNGIVEEGTCHSIDMKYCIREWEDGCTEIISYYAYYNLDSVTMQDFEEYYYLRVTSTTGCDSSTNPAQPENGCAVESFGLDNDGYCTECVSDGESISLMDCSNLADVLDPPQDQVISLTQGGEYFDVVQTDEMCAHPAVLASSDATRGPIFSITDTTIGSTSSSTTLTFPLDITLDFSFDEGQGTAPDEESIQWLVVNTLDYFTTVLMSDETFSGVLLDIEMLSITPDYSTEAPDDFTLTLTADIVIDASAISQASSKLTALDLAQSDLNKYLRDYVRTNPTNQRNAFSNMKEVRFKAVGSQNHA